MSIIILETNTEKYPKNTNPRVAALLCNGMSLNYTQWLCLRLTFYLDVDLWEALLKFLQHAIIRPSYPASGSSWPGDPLAAARRGRGSWSWCCSRGWSAPVLYTVLYCTVHCTGPHPQPVPLCHQPPAEHLQLQPLQQQAHVILSGLILELSTNLRSFTVRKPY